MNKSESPKNESSQAQKSASGKSTTPLTSCSSSPSSVRINQNYDPNNLENQTPKSPQNSEVGNKLCSTVSDISESQDTSNRDTDLDNSEDADRKPLLDKCDVSPVLVNNKHGRSNDLNTIENGVNSENVTLINNCN